MILAIFLLIQSCIVSALLLSPEGKKPVNVLVFGDSWGAWGPSFHMLDFMFRRHGVQASVKSTAISGTRACQWATSPKSLARAVQATYPIDGAHFVWLTVSGNDLLEPWYLECSNGSTSIEEATNCALMVADKVQPCISSLLDSLWKEYPKIKVVQCAYEMQCTTGTCAPFTRFPYCVSNASCGNIIGTAWQKRMLNPLIEKYESTGRYKGLSLNGILQSAAGYPGTALGKPDMSKGAPCELMVACVHPNKDGLGAFAIGEVFWREYFSKEVTANIAPRNPQKINWTLPANVSIDPYNQEDISVVDTYCNYNWAPAEDGSYAPPPCNRMHYP